MNSIAGFCADVNILEALSTGPNPTVWFVMGPTASGKTALAVSLAKHFPIEVINVDSSLVYRGMDIGTAKPNLELLEQCPHHLIDIREPQDVYSAAEFCTDARRLITEITSRNRTPLLVGGTMFYFRALEKGLSQFPPANPELRQELAARGKEEGWPCLHRELERLDPARARQINPMDRQRVQRALEIVYVSGQSGIQPLSPEPSFCAHKIVISPGQRECLHRRVERRFQSMLEQGLVEEVKNLIKRPEITTELPALRMVGYRQVVEFLTGQVTYNVMIERAIAATRQLAKRQLTWLRNQSGVTWFDSARYTGGEYTEAILDDASIQKKAVESTVDQLGDTILTYMYSKLETN